MFLDPHTTDRSPRDVAEVVVFTLLAAWLAVHVLFGLL